MTRAAIDLVSFDVVRKFRIFGFLGLRLRLGRRGRL